MVFVNLGKMGKILGIGILTLSCQVKFFNLYSLDWLKAWWQLGLFFLSTSSVIITIGNKRLIY